MKRPKVLEKGCPLCYPKNEKIIKENDLYRVILVDEIPGYVRLVMNEHYQEITDLEFNEYQKVYAELYKIERAMREFLKPDKVNVASLGNYVPHLHFHIIPRFKEDGWFPDSIWSEKKRDYEYQIEEKQIEKFIKRLKRKS